MENNKMDDFQDLEPIVMTKASGYAPRKPVSNEISFGPVTAERIMYVVVALLIVSVVLPWMTMRISIIGIVNEFKVTQIKDNTIDSIWVISAAVLTIVASFRRNIRYLISSIALFAFSAWRVLSTSSRVAKAQGMFGASFEVEYHIGFYLYIVAAVLMVLAVILRLLDKNE